ncbi:MAG TPA: polysaccharide deacetylase family protein [Nocardioidaceae bacterium]|nr:polysaccharide deacetylase family protein [Nocardioidaceae bacterium]
MSRLVALLVAIAMAAGCDAGHDAQVVVPSPRPSVSASPSPIASPTLTPARAGCAVPSRLAGQDISRLPGDEPRVALTFDAGGNADGVRSILRTLTAKRARATFFLTGDFVRTYPHKARRIARLHLVGNHTDTHANAVEVSDAELTGEIAAAQRVITRVTGEDPRRFFRFPFGARTDHDIAVVNSRCYVPFRWAVDTLGWRGRRGGSSVASVLERVRDAASPGAIVLMHVGANPYDDTTLDAAALPAMIDWLRQAGFRLVRLSAVMRPAP